MFSTTLHYHYLSFILMKKLKIIRDFNIIIVSSAFLSPAKPSAALATLSHKTIEYIRTGISFHTLHLIQQIRESSPEKINAQIM